MIALLLSLPGCSGSVDEVPAWAVNYGAIVPGQTGAEGVQVWNFYGEGWDRRQDEDLFQCAVVQSLDAEVIAALPGCEGCVVMLAVQASVADGDCRSSLEEDPGLDGVLAYGFGEVPEELADRDPFPGATFGWYISLDGETALPHGFAWPEALEWGTDAPAPGWNQGQVYTLWPAYAWSL